MSTPTPSPHVYGVLPPEVLNAVSSMQSRSAELLSEIGRLELRKSQLLDELKHLEKQARGLLNQEATRLGIPTGTPWQLTPTGEAIAVPGASPQKSEN